jgi:hypothetical protein
LEGHNGLFSKIFLALNANLSFWPSLQLAESADTKTAFDQLEMFAYGTFDQYQGMESALAEQDSFGPFCSLPTSTSLDICIESDIRRSLYSTYRPSQAQ